MKQVNTTKMVLISFIPFGWFYIFNKIKKRRLGIKLLIIFFIGGSGINQLFNYLDLYFVGLAINLALFGSLEIFFIRKQCKIYNQELLK